MALRFLSYKSSAFPQGRIGLLNSTGLSVTPINFPTGRPIVQLRELIEQWDAVSSSLLPGQPEEQVSDVTILPPLPGRDVLCVGKNYVAHAKEFQTSGFDSSDRNEQPDFPVIFTKRASSIVGPGTEIYPHPDVTETLDYEGELGVIIGTTGTMIKKENAWDHVWGAVVVNDVTARERQRDHKQFYIGKSLDTFCPMGPYAVHKSNLDWDNLVLETRVNGEVRQHQNTKELIFDIPTLVETCSRGITIQAGDLIATGTPAGVGIGRSPPIYLKPGDVVEVEITGLGVLTNKVGRADLPPPATGPVSPARIGPPSVAPDALLRTLPSGLALHATVSGDSSKPTIVFVHGLGGSSTNYLAIIAAAKLEDTHQVVTFDLEGHGLSPLSGEDVTIPSYAESIREVLDSVGAKTATIVGHSMGGLVVTTFAAKNPDRVDKLVLLGPVKQFAEGGVKALTARAGTVREGGMAAVADAIASAGISALTASTKPLARSAVLASLLATPSEGYALACLAAARGREPVYSAIASPTLIISADEDKTAPKATIDFLAGAIKGAKVVELKETGHWLPVEQYEQVAKEIVAFL